MRHRTTGATLLAILLFSAAARAETATVTVSPAHPTTDDVVALTLAGQWPNACAPGVAVQPNVSREGTKVNVLFSYTGFSGACATVITPWSTQISLGKLPAGTYQADVVLSRSLAPAESLGSATFTVSAPQQVRAFVPAFLAQGGITLSSRLTAFNNGAGNASIGLVAAYDDTGRHDLSGSAVPLASGAATQITTDSLTPAAVRFVEVETTTHVALRPGFERQRDGAVEGRIALPVFPAAFAAGSTVVAGDIRLHDGFKRANLTLFNAGSAAASFQVTVTSALGEPLYTQTLTLNAQSAKQFNTLALEPTAAASAWVKITADQPFLAYASATYDDSEAGRIPYEIFPARPEL